MIARQRVSRHDPQAYLEALARFWADARDALDDPTFEVALPLLEQLRRVPEPRDPDDPPGPDPSRSVTHRHLP